MRGVGRAVNRRSTAWLLGGSALLMSLASASVAQDPAAAYPPVPTGLYDSLVLEARGVCLDCHAPEQLGEQLKLRGNPFFQALMQQQLPAALERRHGQWLDPVFMEVANALGPHMGYYHYQPASMPMDSEIATDDESREFLKRKRQHEGRTQAIQMDYGLRAILLNKPLDGKLVFDRHCAACHQNPAMMLAAPQITDSARWKVLMQAHHNRREEFYEDALQGEGAMPARGGVPSLSDAAVKAAVDHMLDEAQGEGK